MIKRIISKDDKQTYLAKLKTFAKSDDAEKNRLIADDPSFTRSKILSLMMMRGTLPWR